MSHKTVYVGTLPQAQLLNPGEFARRHGRHRGPVSLIRLGHIDAAIVTASTSPMMDTDAPGLMWTHSLPIIFAPVNTSTAAMPCRRYGNRSSASDTTKYNERRPNIANTFELYTMSGFRVI